jgi:hypothetical protein
MALADIPGYGAYVQRRAMNEAAPMQELQQVGALQSLLMNEQKFQKERQLQDVLKQSNGDVEKVIPLLIQSGNVEGAARLAPILEEQRKAKQLAALQGMDTSNPDVLERAGMLLGKPEFITHAERLRKQANDRDTLAMMRDTPQGLPAGATVSGATNQQILKPIPPDEVAAYNRVLQQANTAKGDIATSAPQEGDPQLMGGGALAPLMESQSPAIAAGARQLQALINNPNFKGDPAAIQRRIDSLTAMDAKFTEAKTARDERRDLSVTLKSIVPGDQPGPTSDTIEMDAWRYLTDGTLPPNMGRGAQGATQATNIRNRAAELAKDMGMSPDEIRMAQLTNKTQVQAIGQLARAKAQILQFEKLAAMNADLALDASSKVDRTGIPILNKWIQAGRTNVTGDPDTAKFHAATETFVTEYAKVMSGGYGAAATTEGAQARAHTLLNTANTKEQFSAIVGQLKREMQNRVASLNAQMDEERNNLRRGVVRSPDPSPSPSPSPSPAPSPTSDAGVKSAAEAAWGAYEPGKYDYRMNAGKLQRRPKGG